MALTAAEKKVVRLMIRGGIDDATIDAMGDDDAVARTEIATYKAAQLPRVLMEIQHNEATKTRINDVISDKTSMKSKLEAV